MEYCVRSLRSQALYPAVSWVTGRGKLIYSTCRGRLNSSQHCSLEVITPPMNYQNHNQYARKDTTTAVLAITFLLLMVGLAYGQNAPRTSNLPDWSGAWSMVGGT